MFACDIISRLGNELIYQLWLVDWGSPARVPNVQKYFPLCDNSTVFESD